ncbi:hypothetical protein ICL29_004091 [Salmonella enterica]|nr:hypothetical protein [Salmonella enterica]EHK5999367.1 hypothetical protein [Salmonella enterica]EIF5124586.1 hypothetical protein [Salmonella enterica]EIF5348762.1 hypothetical protein [Salmonella enterica]EIF5657359.1 hypothetical protein [Salmonella enterica]
MNRNDADRNTLQQCADMLGVSPEQLPDELAKTKGKAEEMDKFFALMDHAGHQLKSGDPINLESFFGNRSISAMAALMFAAEFVRGGGRNFFTFDYDLPEFGRINVTIQKPDHLTPAQRIAELEDGLEELKSETAPLLSRAASELSVSWMLAKAGLCMQAAQLCIKQGDIYEASNWLSYITDEAQADMPDDMTVTGLEDWYNANMVANDGKTTFVTHSEALEKIKEAFPAHSKAVAEVTGQFRSGDKK